MMSSRDSQMGSSVHATVAARPQMMASTVLQGVTHRAVQATCFQRGSSARGRHAKHTRPASGSPESEVALRKDAGGEGEQGPDDQEEGAQATAHPARPLVHLRCIPQRQHSAPTHPVSDRAFMVQCRLRLGATARPQPPAPTHVVQHINVLLLDAGGVFVQRGDGAELGPVKVLGPAHRKAVPEQQQGFDSARRAVLQSRTQEDLAHHVPSLTRCRRGRW